jgi:mono/diheme cytochrome c family protein
VAHLAQGEAMSARPLLALALLAAAGCGSARRGSSVAGTFSLRDPELERGAIAFMANCHKCHPGGEAGLGPAINDKPLPRFLMRLQVRKGLGAMPSFSERQISDGQLDDLLGYLVELRGH